MFQIFALPLKLLKAVGQVLFAADTAEMERWQRRAEAERLVR